MADCIFCDNKRALPCIKIKEKHLYACNDCWRKVVLGVLRLIKVSVEAKFFEIDDDIKKSQEAK